MTTIVSEKTVTIDAASLTADNVYPELFFKQRVEEEIHRAHRMRAVMTLILVQGDIPTLAHKLRAGIRRMDVLGLWKGYLAVLMLEIPRDEVSPSYAERLSQQSQGIMRIAGVVDTQWQEIYLGACMVPEVKSGKIEPGELIAHAEKALGESTLEHQPILYNGPHRFVNVPRQEVPVSLVRYGDLHLSRDSHKAWIGPECVEFLPKEFELLNFLVKHQGKLVRRDTLCKTVWGYDYTGSSRTVDMHVAKLRKKIKSSRSLSIKTLKGEGYRLDLNV